MLWTSTEDFKKRGFDVEFDSVLESLRIRDCIDKERTFAPLEVPEGAFVLDTSRLTVEKTVKIIEAYILNTNPEIRL